jgi:lipid-A-disaccharide synthase-like uncharacterized protein
MHIVVLLGLGSCAALLYFTISGVRRGEVGFASKEAKRSENPVLFWFMVAGNLFYVIAGFWLSYLVVSGRIRGW